MDEKAPLSPFPGVSPVAQHRKQMRMQVWLPLAITMLVVLALMVLTVVGAARGSDQVNRWGNLSAVWIILPMMLTCLVALAVIGASVYGMNKLLQKMPGWMLSLQLRLLQISLTMRRAADAAATPVIKANTFSARVGALWRRFFGD